MPENPENEEKTPAGAAQGKVAESSEAQAEDTDELSWGELDAIAGGANGTATLTADLSD